jgi:hypothetical protein
MGFTDFEYEVAKNKNWNRTNSGELCSQEFENGRQIKQKIERLFIPI